MISPGAAFAAARARRPLLDHVVRTVVRYQADTGDRLAAAVTFYWFLSLFPILLLVLAGYGYLHAGESAQQLNARLAQALGGLLPRELISTLTDTLATAKGKAGLLGLAGLLLSGLGWIDALREAIRAVWHHPATTGNLVTRKLNDVAVLVGLFATIAASAFVTGLAGSGPKLVLEQLDVAKTPAATLFLKLVGIVLGVAVDAVLFLYLFLRLARVRTSVREVLRGAVFGAIGFGVLKLVGGFYVQHTTTSGKTTYGTFAVVVGLLLFLNLVSRLVLVAAAFVVTAPYDGDTRPSATAGGAPPRADAGGAGMVGPASPGDGDTGGAGMEQSWAARPAVPVTAPDREPDAPAVPASRGAEQVRLAARATAAAGGLVVAAVAVYAARTLRGLVRR